MMNIFYYRNTTGLRAFNGFTLRIPAPPFCATDLCNQIKFFRFKFYSRPLASQALGRLVLRDKIALAFKRSVTVANTAYMQWLTFDRILHLISPYLCVPGLRLRPCPATAHTPERWR
jgi:hypothetical protein